MGLVLTALSPPPPIPGGNNSLRLSSGASPAVLMLTFGSPGTRDSDSKKGPGGSMQETQVQMHVHLPESLLLKPWGCKLRGPFPRSISQTQEKAAQATPRSPAISKKKAWGWRCRRNLRTDPVGGWHVSSYWTADLTRVHLGLDCICRDLLVVVHRGCDRLTLDGVWLATGVTGHS